MNTETQQTKSGYLVLLSRMILEEKLPIRFMYKTVPEHLNDTGWRLFSGYEPSDFFSDEKNNMLPMPLETLTQFDSTLAPLLEYNAGTVWERRPEASDWERVYDFRIPAANVATQITNDIDHYKQQ